MSLRVALLLALFHARLVEGAERIAHSPEDGVDSDDTQESSVSYLVLVERSWSKSQCAGVMVSDRAALSSATCAAPPARLPPPRAPPAPPAIWLRASRTLRPHSPSPGLVRRVRSVALPPDIIDDTQSRNASWHTSVNDLAALELEEPFPRTANVRAVLLASLASDCDLNKACYAAGVAGGRLRVVTLRGAAGPGCGGRTRYWGAVRERALCLQGDTLCQEDRGTGVVCRNGKLCGVISQSVQAPPPLGERGGEGGERGAGGGGCGDTHATQYLVLWKKFLHCALAEHSCGRADCATMCIERNLLEEEEPISTDPTTHSPHSPLVASGRLLRTSKIVTSPAATLVTSQAPATISFLPDFTEDPRRSFITSVRAAVEFEPNRADFKVGEYGDNAAEYVMEDMPTRSSLPSPSPSRTIPREPQSLPPAPPSPRTLPVVVRYQATPKQTDAANKHRCCVVIVACCVLFSMSY